MRLADLLTYTEVLAAEGDLNSEVRKITFDSRQVREGSLFVAIPGYKSDGHEYIREALSNGAIAVVIQDPQCQSDNYTWVQVPDSRKALADLSAFFWGFPSSKLSLIGVTGTNGKTTTTNLIAAILEDHGLKTGLIGTIHNRIGQETIPVHHTTPEAPELQALFQDFLNKNAKYAVMEVSSHALDLHRVRGCEFDVAVYTNLTQDHLDFHQDMDKYLASKSKLFIGLGKNPRKERRKYAIINIDDPYGSQLAELSNAPVITYGVNKTADVKANQVEVSASGVKYQLRYTNQIRDVSLKLTGTFNVYNSLAAIAFGLMENLPVESIISSLERIDRIPGRFEKVDAGQDYTVIVDYSHTPDSLENCLRTAREFVRGRIITVFGCGGDRDKTKRPIMGEVAGRYSDIALITSDNPRSEDPQEIIKEIVPGISKVMKPNQFIEIVNRREAIFKAIGEARPGDVVIIAGKGHEDYQVIGDRVLHFSDQETALEAIKARGYTAPDIRIR